uniref:PDZ domain-containing protein n=1 Tax=Romanomermis culicivorax TaxID=13658 RepID=A0A915I480_ROMCU
MDSLRDSRTKRFFGDEKLEWREAERLCFMRNILHSSFKDKASTSCSKFNEVIVNDNAADDDALSNELYDITDDQLQNLEYEEITLYRPSRNTKLGLTLWYENDGDMETNIFVSKIENGSLVDLDGRMHAGDQILQICGMDVHTKNQAVELLTHCNRVAKFLVARSLPRLPVTASMMSTISLPQQELIKPEYTLYFYNATVVLLSTDKSCPC